MFESFETLFTNVAGSMDDIFIAVTTFLVLRVVSSWLFWCMHVYFRLSAYVSETVNFLLWLLLSVFVVNHIFGTEISTSLFSGFSIGMGYAFQPYIISLFTGLCNGFMISPGDTIMLGGETLTVKKLSLFYVVVTSGEYQMYVPHSFFKSTPLKVRHAPTRMHERSQFTAKQ